jgi:hypothetical protein
LNYFLILAKDNAFNQHTYAHVVSILTWVRALPQVAGMGLYAAAAFWAQLSRGIWEASPIKVGILSIPGGASGAGKLEHLSVGLLLIKAQSAASWLAC